MGTFYLTLDISVEKVVIPVSIKYFVIPIQVINNIHFISFMNLSCQG